MFGSPSSKRTRLLKIAGIPIYGTTGTIILMVLILLFYGQGGPQQMLTAVFVMISFIVGIVLHEVGHAVAIKRLGYGRSEIVLTGLGGVTLWRGAPTPRNGIIIAAAGPAVSLLLAGLSFGFLTLAQPLSASLPILRHFFIVFGTLNLFWGVFNLLPIYPMDGGKIVRSLLRRKRTRREATKLSLKFSFIAGGLVLLGAILSSETFVAVLIAFLLLQNWNEWKTLA